MHPKVSSQRLAWLRVEFEFLSNPEILIVDFLSITKGRFSVPKKFEFNDIVYHTGNGDCYYLIATLNQPSFNHFNCSVFDPYDGQYQYSGWWMHDGTKSKGNLVKSKKGIAEVISNKPRILFYKKK